MKHVASLSGGRTSTGPLPHYLIKEFGKENVDLIFMDTGAEHPDTYRFVRDTERELDVKITCLKLVMPSEHGKGAQYKVCTTSEIGGDYFGWKQLTSKYGNPFMPGGKFCTDQMKTQPFNKYCNDTYGKGNYYTWLGYRFEEGNRIWGKDASNALGKVGMDNTEKTQFYLDCLGGRMDKILDDYYPAMFPSPEDEKQKGYIRTAFENIQGKQVRYLPEICRFDKNQVIGWWSGKGHDLRIDEHKTNCVFCIEKPHSVLMLAIKDEPELAKEYLTIVESDSVAHKPNRQFADDVMYRDNVTFRWLYNKAQQHTREEILYMSRMGQKLAKKNPCASGECQPFSNIHEEQQALF